MAEKTGSKTLEELIGSIPKFSVLTRNPLDPTEYGDRNTIYGVKNLGDLYREVMKRVAEAGPGDPSAASPSGQALEGSAATSSRAQTSGPASAGPSPSSRGAFGSSGPLKA